METSVCKLRHAQYPSIVHQVIDTANGYSPLHQSSEGSEYSAIQDSIENQYMYSIINEDDLGATQVVNQNDLTCDSSSDEEIDEQNCYYETQISDSESQHEVILVFAVNPNSDLEDNSSDEELGENAIVNSNDIDKDTNETTDIVSHEKVVNGDNIEVQKITDNVKETNETIDTVGHEKVVKEENIKNQEIAVVPGERDYDLIFDTSIESLGLDFDALAVSKAISEVDEFLDNKVHSVEFKDDNVGINDFDTLDKKTSKVDINPETYVGNINIEEFFIKYSDKEDPAAAYKSASASKITNLSTVDDIKMFLMDELPSPKKIACLQASSPLPSVHSIERSQCLPWFDPDDGNTLIKSENVHYETFDVCSVNKNNEILTTLTDEDVNSFLLAGPGNMKDVKISEDDLTVQDMDLDTPLQSRIIQYNNKSSPLNNSNKKIRKNELIDNLKTDRTDAETDDFVDVESCDNVVPVLKATNLNSLLEQFEASEKHIEKEKDPKTNRNQTLKSKNTRNDMGSKNTFTEGTKKNLNIKSNSTYKKVSVQSEHNYCSLKGQTTVGKSLLKPEVLSSNNRILNSRRSTRHRSCKNKKIVYCHSSDDEIEKVKPVKNKKDNVMVSSKIQNYVEPNKPNIKQNLKTFTSNHCKKNVSNFPRISETSSYTSVVSKKELVATDKAHSQVDNGSIKLIIKNKSKLINSNHEEKTKNVTITSSFDGNNKNHKNITNPKKPQNTKDTVKRLKKVKHNEESKKNKPQAPDDTVERLKEVELKEESILIKENGLGNVVTEIDNIDEAKSQNSDYFYTTLFTDKNDVKIPPVVEIQVEKRPLENESKGLNISNSECLLPPKKKKLNLQEYKMRMGTLNINSMQSTHEQIFPDINCIKSKKTDTCNSTISKSSAISMTNHIDQKEDEQKFDPIREASRKILLNTKKQKAAAIRKREEEEIMRNLPKIENLELQPLITDAELMQIVETTPEVVPPPLVKERLKPNSKYVEKIIVSVGTNTDENLLNDLSQENKNDTTTKVSCVDSKSLINFKIKKVDNVLKKNVFATVKNGSVNNSKIQNLEPKNDQERYKDITAVLENVGKRVDTKIATSSLFASIQETVMKKAPVSTEQKYVNCGFSTKNTFVENCFVPKSKPIIIRDYNADEDHGEDKTILHLDENKNPPLCSSIATQTESSITFNKPTIKSVLPKSSTQTGTSLIMDKSTPLILDKNSIIPKCQNNCDMTISFSGKNTSSQLKLDETDKSTISVNSASTVSSKRKLPLSEENTLQKRFVRSKSKDKRSRSKDSQSRSKDSRSASKNSQSRSTNSQSRSTNSQSRSTNSQSRSTNSQSRSKNSRSRSKNSRSRSKNSRSRSKNSRSRSKNTRSRSKDRPSTSKNEGSKSRDKQLTLKNKRSDSKDRCLQLNDKQSQLNGHNSRHRRYSRSSSRSRRRSSSRTKKQTESFNSRRRNRRSVSPYRRRRSRSRDHSRHRYKNSKSSHSRQSSVHSKSPVNCITEISQMIYRESNKTFNKSLTPPMRKRSISESSSSSSSSSSSRSSSSSLSSDSSSESDRSPSRKSRRSRTPYSTKSDDRFKRNKTGYNKTQDRDDNSLVEERRIVFVGRLEQDITKLSLRSKFVRFGKITEVRLHSKPDGSRYGFVTFQHAKDAWTAVGSASLFPQYDVGFGGRRQFCRQTYADLDGEIEYTESMGVGQPRIVRRRKEELSWEEMLLEMKRKLSERKNEQITRDDV